MLTPRTRSPSQTWVRTAVILVTAAFLAACSSSPSTSESPAASIAASVAASAAASAAPSETASGGAQSGSATVNIVTVPIVGRSFGSAFMVTAGTTVTFINKDAVPHTVTNGMNGQADPNPLFDEALANGASTDVVFDTPGVFNVTCKIHHTMNLTITVQ